MDHPLEHQHKVRVFVPRRIEASVQGLSAKQQQSVYAYGWVWTGSDGRTIAVIAGVSNAKSDLSRVRGSEFGCIGVVQLDSLRTALLTDSCASDRFFVFALDSRHRFSARFLVPPTTDKSPLRRSITSCETIYFRQPRSISLQYMSLDPLILDLSLAQTIMNASNSTASTPIDVHIARHLNRLNGDTKHQNSPEAAATRHSEYTIAQNMLKHISLSKGSHQSKTFADVRKTEQLSVPLDQKTAATDDVDLKRALEKINECYERDLELRYPSGRTLIFKIQTRAVAILQSVFKAVMLPFIWPCIVILFLARVFAEAFLWLLNKTLISTRVAFKDVSTFGYQANLRLQQACFWPWQYREWQRSSNKLSPLCQAQYIGFYNVVWLIANDIIIGVTLGSFLMMNSVVLAEQFLATLDYFTLDGIKSVIEWLMGWPPPAGLKLNSELNGFLGQLFLWILYMWRDFVIPLRDNLPTIIYCIGIAGYFGATVVLSLLSDLVAVLTLQLFLFYVVAAKIYSWQVDAILSLLTIFRGKKLNVLRNRVDSSEFDVNQLLVGAILFALLVFLFPTVAVYYLLFSLTRVGVICIQGGIEILLAFLNHFPLFAIMLRFKDPNRLPAGIQFELVEYSFCHAYFEIESVPIGASAIFYQYTYIVNRLVNYYLTSATTSSFFTGRAIETVPRLQYPTLPERNYAQLPNVFVVWQNVNAFIRGV
ncbi:phosphatidylinositol N-acetylglucosaminyltransferase subunit gpi1 [Chytriomyces hyalinus]|nr:phosphatidylinositol N-acetylglucosaminyltransferase subunit gpi1 [Chytriomyces hyalinus]